MNASLRYCAIALVLLSLTSCRTVRVIEQVPVEVHDTVYQKMVQRDSIYIDHFREVTKMNDTIYITDEVTKTKIVTKTDTAYRYIERPVTVSKTETVEVKKPLAWWQKGFIGIGVVSLIALLGIVVWKTRKWWSRII